MHCNQNPISLEAYVDGQLPAADARQVETHLAACAPCAQEVRRLQKLSGIFSSYRPPLPAGVLDRLHETLERSRDLGILRLARTISAMAASVVLFGSLYLAFFQSSPSSGVASAAIPVWEQTAVSEAPTDGQTANASGAGEQQQLAEWIVSDLSNTPGNAQ
jgi:anti-sigma factor RsiW